ncbi:MAG TPA: citrate synthase family protein [Nevskia sp.]|nr:citrate synthase family protein [Nevskia sp.]
MSTLISAGEACALLGVMRPTLYSYVSRGLLRALPGPDHRTHRYRRSEVERLAQRPLRRRAGKAASGALDFGPPLLESGLCLIERGHLYFRGVDAAALADGAGLEQVARLLWAAPDDPFAQRAPSWPPPRRAAAAAGGDGMPLRRAQALFALGAAANDDNPAALLREMAACLLGVAPSAMPIHRQCARAWRLQPAGEALVRGALVLCADHELNASGFAARVIASTGASLREAVRGGLGALSGPRHGQMTALVEQMWDELDAGAEPRALLARRLEQHRAIPGFGHPLYPDGDPRARWILGRLPADGRREAVLAAALDLQGEAPALDFALVALRRHLRLPAGGAFVLFCLGRCVGWIAHALEQRPLGLIRPRAVYGGVRPPAVTDAGTAPGLAGAAGAPAAGPRPRRTGGRRSRSPA